MARVFVSHANDDREITDEVHRWLVAEGHEVFLDRDPRDGMVVGEEWEQRLSERLRWADAVVCVVTSAFLASKWCPYEVGYARSQGSRLLSVLAEPGVDHPLVRSAHYADITKDPAAGRAALVEALRRVDALGGFGWPDGKSPFPGLRPLDVDEHRVFFGRSREVQQLAGLVRSPAEQAVSLVVGPSGCGKSSLVRAGLLPVIADEPSWWTLAPMLPGADPVVALARELTTSAQRLGLDWTVAGVRRRLDDTGLTGLADELLDNQGGRRRRRLLVVVDQFEELLTRTPPGHRAHFAQLLRPALGGPVQIVATLRTEFLDQLLVDADLAVLPTRTYTLRPLHREALREVIQGPARLAGIEVNDELVARLVADTDSGEALPLLAFTLAQLADGVGRGGHLSSTRYDQLGGVQSALTCQADAALADAITAGGRRGEEVIAGLLRLVTVDEQGRPTRWRISRDELPKPVTRELDAFVTRRLVTTDTDNGNVIVGVAHETFLTAWPPLTRAINENMSALRARRAVEQAATDWHDHDRSPDRLWERGQLAAAVADTGARIQAHNLVTDRVELSPTARTFLRLSIRRDRARRGRATAVLSVLLVLALAATVVAFVQHRTAEQHAKQLNVTGSRQAAEQAMEQRTKNPALAALLSLAAYRLAPTTEARNSLLNTFATPYATQLTGHTNGVHAVAFSPDGRTLATGSDDTTVRLWDVHDPHHAHPLGSFTAHTTAVQSVAFSSDGHTLATGSFDEDARLWDVSDLYQPRRHPYHPRLLRALPGPTHGVYSVAFSSDKHTLATGGGDGIVRLWNVSDPRNPGLPRTLTGHTTTVLSVTFSADGHTLATGSFDQDARLWDVSDPGQPHQLHTLTGHTKGVYSVAFSSDKRTLATGGGDGIVRLWNVSDPYQPHPLDTLTGHAQYVWSVAFSADGHTLATGSYDKTVRLWDVSDPYQPHPLDTLTGHSEGVFSVAFSHDGRTLATGSDDTTVRLWDLLGPTMTGHTKNVNSVAFSPNGHILATGSDDKTVRLWNVSEPYQPHLLGTLTGHTKGVFSVAFSHDGNTLATGSYDKTVRLWDVSNPDHSYLLRNLTGHTGAVRSVAFSPNGHTLATGSDDKTVRLWDVSDLHQLSPLGTLIGDTQGVSSVTFSSDSHTLATGTFDDTVQLWDVSDPDHSRLQGSFTTHTKGVLSVAFSSDNHTLATGSRDGTVRLWNVSDPHQLSPLDTLTGHTRGVSSVAFSHDGHTLATGSDDKTVRLWNISNPRHRSLFGILTSPTKAVSSVAFSTDGRILATGSLADTAQLWETNVDSIASRICSIIPDITKRQWEQYLHDLPYRPLCL
ncbi:MAG: TIR domain-containing protein [Pseudonocardiaceae bacterium]